MKILMAICFVLMMIAGGHDGKYFPYLNFIGVIFFGVSLLVLADVDRILKNKKGKYVS